MADGTARLAAAPSLESAGAPAVVRLLFDDTEFDTAEAGMPSAPELQRWAEAALQALGIVPAVDVEISVQRLTSDEMQQLNRQYRQRDQTTNVLSFPSGLPPLMQADGRSLSALGDIVFCPAVIAAEASAQGKSLANHWAHMTVHAVLHLAGHDHEDEAEADVMEALEIRILADLAIADPYRLPVSGELPSSSRANLP